MHLHAGTEQPLYANCIAGARGNGGEFDEVATGEIRLDVGLELDVLEIANHAPQLHDETGGNLSWSGVYVWGDLVAAFAVGNKAADNTATRRSRTSLRIT